MNELTVEQLKVLEYMREDYSTHGGEWDYETLDRENDLGELVSLAEFTQFDQEIDDGDRCRIDGKLTNGTAICDECLIEDEVYA